MFASCSAWCLAGCRVPYHTVRLCVAARLASYRAAFCVLHCAASLMPVATSFLQQESAASNYLWQATCITLGVMLKFDAAQHFAAKRRMQEACRSSVWNQHLSAITKCLQKTRNKWHAFVVTSIQSSVQTATSRSSQKWRVFHPMDGCAFRIVQWTRAQQLTHGADSWCWCHGVNTSKCIRLWRLSPSLVRGAVNSELDHRWLLVVGFSRRRFPCVMSRWCLGPRTHRETVTGCAGQSLVPCTRRLFLLPLLLSFSE